MILPKIFLVFFSICFIFHSLYNVYENILQAKTVDYTYSVNLTDIEFPFNFRITLIPGKSRNDINERKFFLTTELTGIDDEKLKSKGFYDIWGYFLAVDEHNRKLYKKIQNISGRTWGHWVNSRVLTQSP